MEVTFQLTPQDYRQGLLAWRNKNAWRRWLLRSSYFLMSLTIPVAVLLAFIHPDSNSLTIPAVILVFAAGWFTFMLGGPWFSARLQFRRTPSAQAPMTFEISDAGIHAQSQHFDSRLSWSTYIGWAEGKSIFVLFPQPRIYVPIPKRAFTDEQLIEFRDILRRNIVSRQGVFCASSE